MSLTRSITNIVSSALVFVLLGYSGVASARFLQADPMSIREHVQMYQEQRLRDPAASVWHPPLELNPYVALVNNPLRWIDPTGLATITFNANTGTVTVMNVGGAEGTYSAANNTDSRSNGPFPPGTFPFSYYKPHPESNSNGSYGSNGIFIFDVPRRTGMGVHSGRANSCDDAQRCGVEHATNGCVRTTDDATEALKRLHQGGDPVTSITVIR